MGFLRDITLSHFVRFGQYASSPSASWARIDRCNFGNVIFCNCVTTAYAAISGCFTPFSSLILRLQNQSSTLTVFGSSVLDMEYFEFLSTYSCYLRKSIQETINKEESFTELDDVFWGIQNKKFLVITQLLGVLRNNHSQTLLAPHPLTSLLTKWSEYIPL